MCSTNICEFSSHWSTASVTKWAHLQQQGSGSFSWLFRTNRRSTPWGPRSVKEPTLARCTPQDLSKHFHTQSLKLSSQAVWSLKEVKRCRGRTALGAGELGTFPLFFWIIVAVHSIYIYQRYTNLYLFCSHYRANNCLVIERVINTFWLYKIPFIKQLSVL